MNNMMIVVIVPYGDSEKVVQAASKAGAIDCTILHGRGATELVKESPLSLHIESEQKIVLIVVPEEVVETVCNKINDESKNDFNYSGTLFVLPLIR